MSRYATKREFRSVPWPPLEHVVTRRGPVTRSFAIGTPERRAFYRCRSLGRVPLSSADRLADALGLHPVEIWGHAYFLAASGARGVQVHPTEKETR